VREATLGVNPESYTDSPSSVGAPPPIVAIVGRANVGKSTLFNRLARQRRALVEDRPGVTRDRIVAPVTIEGRDLLLVDTGGLDPGAEEGIPSAVQEQARRAIDEAEVILFVVDAREGLLPLDHEIARLLHRAERPVLLLANKAEGPAQEQTVAEFHALGFPDVLSISAEHNRGIADLELVLASRLPARPSVEGAADEDGSVRVAIIGRPNVGKSSLLNRLAGEERAVVSEEPGTTRDPTDVRLEIGERSVTLLDTAGLRRAGRREDRLERGSAWMALRTVERAHVAVLLVDAVEGVTEQDARIARIALERGRPLLIAVNKWDLVEPATRGKEIDSQISRRLRFVPEPVVVRTSARTGSGVGKLLPLALEILENASPTVSTSVVNRALQQAFAENEPPMRGRKRLRFFYATQVARQPFTVLAFVNDPELAPENYRRYLVESLRRRFRIRAARVRLQLRPRSDKDRA
jgi:GTP-binding protein